MNRGVHCSDLKILFIYLFYLTGTYFQFPFCFTESFPLDREGGKEKIVSRVKRGWFRRRRRRKRRRRKHKSYHAPPPPKAKRRKRPKMQKKAIIQTCFRWQWCKIDYVASLRGNFLNPLGFSLFLFLDYIFTFSAALWFCEIEKKKDFKFILLILFAGTWQTMCSRKF